LPKRSWFELGTELKKDGGAKNKVEERGGLVSKMDVKIRKRRAPEKMSKGRVGIWTKDKSNAPRVDPSILPD